MAEAKDNLRSVAYANIVDLVSEGEIVGLEDGLKSIYLNDTVVQNPDGSLNFEDVTFATRTGTQAQTHIQGFNNVENEISVSTEVTNALPITRSVTDSDVDAVRVKVSVQTLLQSDNEGNINGNTVTIAIDLQEDGGGFVEKVSDTFSGKTTSQYQRDYLISFTPGVSGTRDIRVRRVSADSTNVQDQRSTFFDSYTEIINGKLSYPNSALVALRFNSEVFSNIPTRGYLMKLKKIKLPSNYDPEARTYTGIWDGTFQTAWSDNPAWIFYDLLTNTRYGLGEFLSESQVDKWSLYSIGVYCDEMVDDGFGGLEPRFTCNAYLQTREEAFKVIQNLASVFRGMVFWESGTLTAVQDSPKDAVAQFTTSNVIDGLFNYSGVSSKARHTVAQVTWNDPDDNYRQKVEYVEDVDAIERFGVVELEMTAFGVTSRGQANRVGRWALYSEQNETETVTFTTGVNGCPARPGEIIRIQDPVRAGLRLGGRVVSSTSNTLTIDDDLDRDVGGYTLHVMLPDGTISEHTVTARTGTTMTVTPAFAENPQNQAVWILSADTIEPQLFRVMAATEDENYNVTITAVKYYPEKFDAIEQNLTIQPRSVSLLGAIPQLVTSINVSESLVVVKDATQVNVEVSWSPIPGAVSYELRYRVDNSNFVSLGETAFPTASFRDTKTGEYEFQIRSKGFTSEFSQYASFTETIVGLAAPPDQVQDFRVTRRTTDLLLSWTANTDVDLAGYEVRVGLNWDTSDLVGKTKGTQLVHDQDAAGTYYYHIRAFDTSGIYSEDVTTFELDLQAPATVRQFDMVQFTNRLEFRWLPNPEPEVVSYEIREGVRWDTSVFIADVKTTSFSIPAGFDGTRTFHIKAIASPGIYSTNSAFVSNNVAQAKNVNIIATSDQEDLNWPGVGHFGAKQTVDGVNRFVMDSGATRTEYLFDVDLGASVRAQNSLLVAYDAVQEDRTTWALADFAWADSAADRSWQNTAASNIDVRFQLSKEEGLRSDEVYGWRLDDSLDGYGSPTIDDQDGVTYDEGRYGNGVNVTDVTKVSWTVTVPSVFSTYFWFIPNSVETSVIWSAEGSGIGLAVGYDALAEEFFLEDHLGQVVSVPFVIAADDRIFIGISQSTTDRRLYIGKMGGSNASQSESFASAGSYTSLRLY